jgi:hypothetical protein
MPGGRRRAIAARTAADRGHDRHGGERNVSDQRHPASDGDGWRTLEEDRG